MKNIFICVILCVAICGAVVLAERQKEAQRKRDAEQAQQAEAAKLKAAEIRKAEADRKAAEREAFAKTPEGMAQAARYDLREAIRNHLRVELRDYASVKGLTFSEPVMEGDGFKMRTEFRAQNAYGAYVQMDRIYNFSKFHTITNYTDLR
jgi:hypothetical protein